MVGLSMLNCNIPLTSATSGTIPPGDGSRFVLAATDHLRTKTATLEARLRSLEDALAIAQAGISDKPHPLLNLPHPCDDDDEEPTLKPAAEESGAKSESLGSLHIDGKGAARFFGPSGGSESAQDLETKVVPRSRRPLPELDDAYLPEEIKICYRSFPFSPPGIVPATVQPMIETFLPTIERAIELCETFMEHLSWMFQIVTRQQVIKELIPTIYKRVRVSYGPHDLSLMLIVLGIGTLVDLNLPPYSLEAQHYYRLSQAALALQPALGQSIVTVKSLVTGRPPTILSEYIDCHIPTVDDENRFQQDEVPLGFGIWGFQISAQCLIPLVKTTLAVNPPSYQAITDLDRKIRTFVRTKDNDESDSSNPRTATSMASFVRTHYQALLLMFLHRGFFAQAMSDNTVDPLSSPYKESVLAAYSSACVILGDTKSQYFQRPQLISRVWRIWSLAFSSAVIVGTIAIRGAHLNLSPPALEEFEAAFSMFRDAAQTSSRAARALVRTSKVARKSILKSLLQPILQLMLDKAFQVREDYHQRRKPVVPETQIDELSIFGGQTRLVNTQAERSAAPPHDSSSPPHVFRRKTHAGQSCPSSSIPIPPPRKPEGFGHDPRQRSYFETGAKHRATFADISGGWGGLFREASQPPEGIPSSSRSVYPALESGNAAMLDDRWLSFMHNYNILS
ncbi:hypothetical protein H0H92_003983 [Tricholoma furcatifolium]|nr:hypothetical protein H0H92_003983 [Tricholoma furcatifolium]